ncbi:hypothetical protein F2Q69_00014386 [Brassica cretica]|uniref:NYN domain-containing protein n=1 Tax=Brassica cretica TaxID=69181 RepID=A0A8S9QVU4_BRACR|nr:hypothetical protein F2Q69_00014386 [Brassica cretica]
MIEESEKERFRAQDEEDEIYIYAYGYMCQICGLESFGIMPRYFPAVGDRKDKLEEILVDALCCPVDNLDTINLMVIMGDLSGHDEFVVTAFALSCKGGEYNFLIAQPDEFKEQLRSSAKKKWLWSSLLAGRGPLPLTSSMQHLMDYMDAAELSRNSTSPQETSQHGPNTITQQTQPANTQLQRSACAYPKPFTALDDDDN